MRNVVLPVLLGVIIAGSLTVEYKNTFSGGMVTEFIQTLTERKNAKPHFTQDEKSASSKTPKRLHDKFTYLKQEHVNVLKWTTPSENLSDYPEFKSIDYADGEFSPASNHNTGFKVSPKANYDSLVGYQLNETKEAIDTLYAEEMGLEDAQPQNSGKVHFVSTAAISSSSWKSSDK